MAPKSFSDDTIKLPNVSGQFYPGRADELNRFIDEATAAVTVPQDKPVEMVIAPHAGYMYSGGVAAYGYKAVAKGTYKTIVIIGPSHFHNYQGVAVWPAGKFQTPLGDIAIDEEFTAQLMRVGAQRAVPLQSLPQVFTPEHSLEVQLPFIQKDFKDAKIVPLLMGRPDYQVAQNLAAALNETIGTRDDVLVVISTDLSHYHTYDEAVAMDKYTLGAILSGDTQLIWNETVSGKMEMCGFSPVLVGLNFARLRGLNDKQLLKYANSGDVTGDKSRVVGYSSIVYYLAQENKQMQAAAGLQPLSVEQKRLLIETARRTVDILVKENKVLDFHQSDPRLLETQGAFVTLTKHGQLRGCIGRIIGDAPLCTIVRDMAVAAASQDPRFSPVTPDELKDIEVEVSVLSKPEPIADRTQIKMGVHGVIVRRGFNSGVFLPQVATETGWGLEQFMGELCAQKAGLPRDCWKDPKTSVEVFTADVFSESTFGNDK